MKKITIIKEGEITMNKYQLYDYEVWGNNKDGYEVNDILKTNTIISIPLNASDREIIRILKKESIIKNNIRFSSIDFEGETGFVLYFSHHTQSHYRPEFELRCIDK